MPILDTAKQRYYGFHRQRRRRAALRTLRSELEQRAPLIIVHQMGRAASMTLVNTIRASNPGVSVLHTHWLNAANVRERLERVRDRETPWHLAISRTLHEELGESDLRRYPFRIVSVIREPVARNVSAFFLDLDRFIPNLDRRLRAADLATEELVEVFLNDFPHHEALEWFQSQLNEPLDIDWFSQPFPTEKGWQLRDFDNRQMLLIRTDDLNRCYQEAFGALLGTSPERLEQSHVSNRSSPYADLIAQFRRAVRLPQSYLDHVYATPFVSHFFTQQEIDRYRDKWLGLEIESQA